MAGLKGSMGGFDEDVMAEGEMDQKEYWEMR